METHSHAEFPSAGQPSTMYAQWRPPRPCPGWFAIAKTAIWQGAYRAPASLAERIARRRSGAWTVSASALQAAKCRRTSARRDGSSTRTSRQGLLRPHRWREDKPVRHSSDPSPVVADRGENRSTSRRQISTRANRARENAASHCRRGRPSPTRSTGYHNTVTRRSVAARPSQPTEVIGGPGVGFIGAQMRGEGARLEAMITSALLRRRGHGVAVCHGHGPGTWKGWQRRRPKRARHPERPALCRLRTSPPPRAEARKQTNPSPATRKITSTFGAKATAGCRASLGEEGRASKQRGGSS